MEKRTRVKFDIHVWQVNLLDVFRPISEVVDAFPNENFQLRHSSVQAVRLLNSKELCVVPENFPLVAQNIYFFNLLPIIRVEDVDALVDIFLKYGDIEFQVEYSVLVQEVIEFLVHTFHDMVSDFIGPIWL